MPFRIIEALLNNISGRHADIWTDMCQAAISLRQEDFWYAWRVEDLYQEACEADTLRGVLVGGAK